MKFCKYCGEKNKKKFVFCKKCGANLNYKAVEEHSLVNSPKRKKEKNKKRMDMKQHQEATSKIKFFENCLMVLLVLVVSILLGLIGEFLHQHFY